MAIAARSSPAWADEASRLADIRTRIARSVLGSEVEGDAMALIAQKGGAADFARQDAVVTFAAERCFIDAALARNEPHHAFRHVDVEVVADDAPAHVCQGRT